MIWIGLDWIGLDWILFNLPHFFSFMILRIYLFEIKQHSIASLSIVNHLLG